MREKITCFKIFVITSPSARTKCENINKICRIKKGTGDCKKKNAI